MDSGIRQPSQQLVSAAWAAATSAAGAAVEVAPDASRVLQHCHDIITRLPDAQQRWVVNALALARRPSRGTAKLATPASIDGAATSSDDAPHPLYKRGDGRLSDRNPDSGTVAAAWDLP